MNKTTFKSITKSLNKLNKIVSIAENFGATQVLSLSIGYFGMEVHIEEKAFLQLAYDLKVETTIATHSEESDKIYFKQDDVLIFCIVFKKEVE